MNDSNTPGTDPFLEPSGFTRQGIVKLAMVVVGTIILAVLILAIFLPALSNGRRSHRNANRQVRGIVQGLATYASGNKGKMPGLTSKGYLVSDVDGKSRDLMPATKHGGTVEGRFWILLDNNAFTGDYLINPADAKTAWTTGELFASNYSFSLLNLHSKPGPLPNDKTRPDQRGRAREWKQSTNTQAILIADRARTPGGHIGDDYDKIYSIYTSEDSERWTGRVGHGDGSVSFENESTLDTQYGAGPDIKADRLFARDQDPGTQADVLADPSATWDDQSNALLGYTSVGYEDDDIAGD
jgi:hypothetical protein